MPPRIRSRRPRLWLAAFAAAALGLAWLGACSSPAPSQPPKREVILSTKADDRRVGAEAAVSVAAEMGLVDNRALAAYVNQVGQRVARNAPRGGFTYKFEVIDQDAPNAFALPGGFIFVSRGLLALSNSEDELAGVLGHEIVHVVRRHAAARQSMMRSMPPIFQNAAMGQVAAYGRNQERESDRLGQALAGMAGYDPNGLVNFLTGLDYLERLQLGFSRRGGFLDSHPTSRERLAEAGQRAANIQWTPRPPIAGSHTGYLRKLDGLVVGTAASEGVVSGDRFIHPDLGFSVRFPNGWDVINSRQAVASVSPRRDAQVVLEFQGRGDDPQQASEEFLAEAEQQGLKLDSIAQVKLGDLPAFRATGHASMLGVHLTWIARGGTIYRLTGVALGGAGSLDGVFNNVARSFRPVPPAQLAKVRETRLRVVTAQAGETVAEISRRTGNSWNLQQTAVMNGIFSTARFESGQLVKVATSQSYRAR